MKFIFYIVITILAVASAIVAFNLSDSPATNSDPNKSSESVATVIKEFDIKTVNVLVAKVNIPIGATVDSSMVAVQPWPENLLSENFVLGDESGKEVVGKIVRSAISEREPFIKSKLANPNDPGFLAANLPAGRRAVTLATDTVSGVAGFIFPGDRVDILFVHNSSVTGSVNGNDGNNNRNTINTSEVLGTNVKVLAINVRSDGTDKAAPIPPSSITLDVSEELAQQIRLAEKNGTLSLSLRSINDNGQEFPVPTGLSDLSHLPESAPPAKTLVIRGPGTSGGRITSTDISSDIPAINGNVGATTVVRGTSSSGAPAVSVPVSQGQTGGISNK